MLQVLALSSEILPIIFYLCFFRRNKGTGLWVVFLYCLLSILVEAFSFPPLNDKIDTFYVYSFFTVCEYSIFAYAMFTSLKEKVHRNIILAGSVIFAVIAFYQFIYLKSKKIDTLSVSVEYILIIIYSIFFLYQELRSPSTMYIYDTKKFWVVMAFFLYSSSTLFLYIYADNFTAKEHETYWIINNFFETLKNILFCIAFTMKENRKPGFTIENQYSDLL